MKKYKIYLLVVHILAVTGFVSGALHVNSFLDNKDNVYVIEEIEEYAKYLDDAGHNWQTRSRGYAKSIKEGRGNTHVVNFDLPYGNVYAGERFSVNLLGGVRFLPKQSGLTKDGGLSTR